MTIVTYRMTLKINAALLTMVLLPVAGCAANGDAAQVRGSSSTRASQLWGRTFVSTSALVPGRPKQLVAGTAVRLTFEEGRLTADAGCNQITGRVRVDGDRLVVSDLGGGLMSCGSALDDQDGWLTAFLRERLTWRLDGDVLSLRTGTAELRLVERVDGPDRALRGARWSVRSFVDGQVTSSVPRGVDAYLTFHEGARVEGSTGCATVRGTATVHGTVITFSGMTVADAACARRPDRLHAVFASIVDGDVTFQIDGDRLVLTRADGRGMHLRAEP